MAEDIPKPLAQARARIEAERAKAEIWFNKQAKKDKTTKAFDGTLWQYVFHVFFAYATEIFNAGLELKWPAAEVRERIEKALTSVIDEAFSSKHYYRESVGSQLYRAGFRKSATNQIRASEEWDEIQTKLRELAEWEAAGDDHQSRPDRAAWPRCLDRAAYPFHYWLVGLDPKKGFSSPDEEGEYWRKKAWKGFHALIRDAERRGLAPASRSEKLAHAIGGLAYDLAVLKANEILEARRLLGDSAIKAFRDESTDIQEQIESAWRASRERMAVSVEDEAKALQYLAQPFHRVRDDLRRLLDSFPTAEAVKPITAEQPANGGEDSTRAAVDTFIVKCQQELSLKVNRKHIWRAAGHTTARQFQFWQASDPKATDRDNQNFRRILAMSPSNFEALLKKKGII
jgi:hypothetical protein